MEPVNCTVLDVYVRTVPNGPWCIPGKGIQPPGTGETPHGSNARTLRRRSRGDRTIGSFASVSGLKGVKTLPMAESRNGGSLGPEISLPVLLDARIKSPRPSHGAVARERLPRPETTARDQGPPAERVALKRTSNPELAL